MLKMVNPPSKPLEVSLTTSTTINSFFYHHHYTSLLFFLILYSTMTYLFFMTPNEQNYLKLKQRFSPQFQFTTEYGNENPLEVRIEDENGNVRQKKVKRIHGNGIEGTIEFIDENEPSITFENENGNEEHCENGNEIQFRNEIENENELENELGFENENEFENENQNGNENELQQCIKIANKFKNELQKTNGNEPATTFGIELAVQLQKQDQEQVEFITLGLVDSIYDKNKVFSEYCVESVTIKHSFYELKLNKKVFEEILLLNSSEEFYNYCNNTIINFLTNKGLYPQENKPTTDETEEQPVQQKTIYKRIKENNTLKQIINKLKQ